MSEEKVFYHNTSNNITVTDRKVLFGRVALPMDSIRIFQPTNANSVGDYALSLVFALIALWLISFMKWWTIGIGLVLLLHPFTTARQASRKEFLIGMQDGSIPDISPKMLDGAEVDKVCQAYRQAHVKFETDTDPRKGLNLGALVVPPTQDN